MTSLKNIIPATMKIDGRNVCLVSDMKSELAYASFSLRGGYYTESNINQIGINHLIEHIIFESWTKCYKDKSRDKNKNSLHSLLGPVTKRRAHNNSNNSNNNNKNNKSCLKFWNNRPVLYNGYTRIQSVDVFIYGLASDSSLIVDYITQMICSCPKHLNLKMLDHIKNTVLTELNALHTSSATKLDSEITYHKIGSKLPDAVGSRHYLDIAVQIENLKKLTIEDVNDYYYRYFTVENAIFFYGGCISETQLRKSISLHLAHSRPYKNINNSISIAFDEKKIFSQEFIQCSESDNKKEKYPVTVIKDPSVKDNAVFTLWFPVEQTANCKYINATSVLYLLQMSIFSMVMSSELMELLRMQYNLVYGISARYVIYSGINIVKISGRCLSSKVKQVIELCKRYIEKRKHNPVSIETINSEKGKFKLSSFLESVSLSNVMTYYEGIVNASMISNGSDSIDEIIKNSKFESYSDCINHVDRVTPSDIMNHFKRICLSNVVAGYSIK